MTSTPNVFISYRRDDTLPITGRMYDRLVHSLGREHVFLDFDAIPFGVDFREHLDEALEDCDVLLVVIGKDWLGVRGDGAADRIMDPSDFVRLEVEAALKRGIPVVPVLVGGVSLPPSDRLPDTLRPLIYRQAATVDLAQDFHVHMDRLVAGLQRAASRPMPRKGSARTGARPPQTEEPVARPRPDPERPDPDEMDASEVPTTDGSAFSRTVRTVAPWAAVGAVSGGASWLGFGHLSDGSRSLGEPTGTVLEWGFMLSPGWIFALCILAVDRVALVPKSTDRWRAFQIAVPLAAVCAWYVAFAIGAQTAETDFAAGMNLAGGVGAAILLLPLMFFWRFTSGAGWLWWGVPVLVGAAMGSAHDLNRLSPWPLFLLWQSCVLFTIVYVALLMGAAQPPSKARLRAGLTGISPGGAARFVVGSLAGFLLGLGLLYLSGIFE